MPHLRPEVPPRTFNELVRLRKLGTEALQRAVGADPKTVTFTCDNCVSAATCHYAFDGYNTDGDCLAVK